MRDETDSRLTRHFLGNRLGSLSREAACVKEKDRPAKQRRETEGTLLKTRSRKDPSTT